MEHLSERKEWDGLTVEHDALPAASAQQVHVSQPGHASNVVQRDQRRTPPHAYRECGERGERKGGNHFQGGTSSGSAPESDLALQVLHCVADGIQPEATSGHVSQGATGTDPPSK